MTEAFNALEVATSGAGVLAAEMARTSWETARDAMARFFRRGNEATADDEIRVLDLRQARLVGSSEAEREQVREEVVGDLFVQLKSFLDRYPEAAPALIDLVRERERSGDGGDAGPRMTARGNTNSQVIMTGNSIMGGSFTYRPEESK